MKTEEILFVDDEVPVLEGYKRILREDFDIHVAGSGDEVMAGLGRGESYAVIVSDMRMPGMNGLELLARVREISPQTIRVVLTGYADIENAMNAINENAVFRFLTKPCSSEVLKKTLTACLMQYKLVTAEKELLESTLMGSIKVLTDILSLAHPAAFGRSLQINRYVRHMVRELRLEAPWRYEAAAMLSQLGCITLEPEVLEAAYCGNILTAEQQSHFNSHPAIGCELLHNIPRLEGIAWIIGQQLVPEDASKMSGSLSTGVAILRVAVALDDLKVQGYSESQAIAELQASPRFDSRIVKTLATLSSITTEMENTLVGILNLAPGMILEEEIRSKSGLLLAAKGQEVTYPLIVRLKNHRLQVVKEKVAVLVFEDLLSSRHLHPSRN